MDFQRNLSWDQAKALADQGQYIRRANWLDRWIFRPGFLFWLQPNVGEARVVQATDFAAVEFLATDWTTMWPDQYICVGESEEPEPQPEPSGPIVQRYEFRDNNPAPVGRFIIGGGGRDSGPGRRFFGERVIENPYGNEPCQLVLTGNVDDTFWYRLSASGSNWIRGSKIGGVAAVNLSLTLSPGQAITIAVTNDYGGATWYALIGTFTL